MKLPRITDFEEILSSKLKIFNYFNIPFYRKCGKLTYSYNYSN